MALSPQWLDELRARVTLSSVIMRTTKLQRAGREWKACCPFHNENTPSFTVSDEKGFYHCFGCGAHGDVIRWMTDQRGLQFMDAVKELAQQAGMDVPAPDPVAAQRAEKRASLVDVMDASQAFFMEQLRAPEGKRAQDYLKSRGFSGRTIREFGFGYAPDSKVALKGALAQFDEAMLVESGMQISVDDKAPYDRFRDRLMLPIHDQRGRVIAFGGRILEARDGVAKYLNSPDTPLFDKGRTLYNLHRAGPASRQSDRMVVVEGYMDVIALADAGIADAVAPLGTALTENQIEMLWRMVDRPILCFDGDNAGQRAAMRAISRALPMLRPGKSLAIVRLPAGLDPDDLLKQRGRAALDTLLDNAASLIETLWLFERDAAPLETPEDKAGLKQRLIEQTEAIEHPDIKSLYRRELLEKFSAFAYPPREQRPFTPRSAGSWRPAPAKLSPETASRLRNASSGGARGELAAAVAIGLTMFPDVALAHAEALARYAAEDPRYGQAIDFALDAAETLDPSGEMPISRLTGLPAPPDKTRFAFLQEGYDPDCAREDLAEAVSLLVERPALEAALQAATARFETDPEAAFAEQQRLLKLKLEFEGRLGQMASRRAARAAPQDPTPPQAERQAEEQQMD